MNDRELLEFAAKAVGIKGAYHEYDNSMRIEVSSVDGLGHEWWSPLDDDGDALRLAVNLKLDFSINVGTQKTRVLIKSPVSTPLDEWVRLNQDHNGNALSSTRRAIVRAAAEIGKSI